MKEFSKFSKFSRALSISALVMLFLLDGVTIAAPFTITDDNSNVGITTGVSTGGMYAWNVNGVDHVGRQRLYYRLGNTGPEFAVDSLPVAVEGIMDTNFDNVEDTLYVKYVVPAFEFEVKYSLDGGAPGSETSDIAVNITITNTGTPPLDFHLFQYTDLDLNGTSDDLGAKMANSNAVRQWDSGLAFCETVMTPAPDHWEVAQHPSTINSLVDGGPTTLSDVSTVGPGDLTWALQWDTQIEPGHSFQVSEDMQIRPIPEPATMILMAAGLPLLLKRKRKS